MDQLSGDKAGNFEPNPLQLKLIRLPRHSDAFRRHAAFAVHP
jgi:hypothetical protein